jgi:hypothetical protein
VGVSESDGLSGRPLLSEQAVLLEPLAMGQATHCSKQCQRHKSLDMN